MAKHHVIDHFKKLAREKVYQQEVWYHMQKSANPVESKLLQEDIDSHLDAVVKALPERQQKVYTLSKREGLSLNEIAATLGITTRTARNHLDRALKIIRRNINKDSFRLWTLAVSGFFIV
jgi:RNA polymerase sigma-70 factor (ECF subfamily)